MGVREGVIKHMANEPLCVGVIGRRTELVLIPSGQGRMRTVSPHELPTGRA